MFNGIKLKAEDFTLTPRIKMRRQLNDIMTHTISHNSDYSLHALASKEAYLTVVYSLELFLVGNPNNHRTYIFNKPHQTTLPPPEALEDFLANTIRDLVKKPPTEGETINRFRAFLIYYLNKVEIDYGT